MNPTLRNRLIAAGAGGAIAIAGALAHWYEGDGPTERVNGVVYHLSYIDPVGVWTVCRGLTTGIAGPGKRYTAAQCEAMETAHWRTVQAAARRQLPGFDGWNKWRQAAILDWLWNFGELKLNTSTMRAEFNRGDVEAGCRQLAAWVKGRVKGVFETLKGLVLRRADEMELCLYWNEP